MTSIERWESIDFKFTNLFDTKCIWTIFRFQIAILQQNQSVLRDELQQTVKPDESLCQQILNMGFDIELIRDALKNTSNDMQRAIENLLRMQSEGTYQNALQEVLRNLPTSTDRNAPSTSAEIQNMADEMQVSFACESKSMSSIVFHRIYSFSIDILLISGLWPFCWRHRTRR